MFSRLGTVLEISTRHFEQYNALKIITHNISINKNARKEGGELRNENEFTGFI